MSTAAPSQWTGPYLPRRKSGCFQLELAVGTYFKTLNRGGDKVVCVWDPQTGSVLHRLEGHKSYVTCCAFSDDNLLLATGSNDQTVIIWNLENADGKITLTKSKSVEKGATNGTSVNLDKYVGEWTVEEVSPWLASLGFAQYEATFREHQIDGQELLHLTHDSLLHSLQIGLQSSTALSQMTLSPGFFFPPPSVEPLGHRSKLLRAMMILKNPLWHQLAVDELNNIRKPGEFCCPITHEIMTDPVLAAGKYLPDRERGGHSLIGAPFPLFAQMEAPTSDQL